MALVLLGVSASYAQMGDWKPDPKRHSEKMAEQLKFTDEQKASLKALNEKYATDDYDRRKYRDELRKIMTEDQKKQAMELRREHMNGQKGGRRMPKE